MSKQLDKDARGLEGDSERRESVESESSTALSSLSSTIAECPLPLTRDHVTRATSQAVGSDNSFVGSIDSSEGRIRQRQRTRSAVSAASTGNQSLGLSLTRTVTKIMKAVQDDNEQTANEEKKNLNRVLESRFDVGDAVRLEDDKLEKIASSRKFGQEKSKEDHEPSVPEQYIPYKGKYEGDIEENEDEDELEHPTIKKVFTNKSTGVVDLPPDGGYGWVITFCVSLIMFSTWGCNSGFGVFLAFYLNANYYPGATKYDYALIAGMTVAIAQGLSPFVMSIVRIIGFKPTMLLGSAFMLAGFLLSSFTTQLWQLYLTQGFLTAVGLSFIFVPATTVLPSWFLKKRAVALGLSLLGTGAGGVTYGLAANKMIQEDGNPKWAYRIIGITCTVSVLVSIVLIRQRNPIPSVGIKSFSLISLQFKQMFALKVLKNPFVLLIATWFTFALFGYNLMIFTLSSYAVARGMSQHEGSILTAVLNGSQAIGRPIMGLAGDKFGRANVTIVLTFFLSILLFAFWIPAHTFVQMLMFSIMMGSCVGVANVMSTVLIADLVLPDQFLASWSFVNYFGSPFLLVCELVAQALTVPERKSNPYLHTQCFAGACFSCALILILIVRELAVRKKLLERQKATVCKLSDWKIEPDPSLDEEIGCLIERRNKYNLLLGPGIKKYFLRMAYPMKV